MKRRHSISQSGYTLLETTIALAILAAAFVLVAQVLATCARQRQAAEQLLVAQLEAANAVERIAALPFDQVSAAKLGELTLSKAAQAALPEGKLTTTLDESTDGIRQKRVLAQVAWTAGVDQPRTVTLTTWRYDSPPPENP
jgi:prepilin-type N-terminal cleavage/methylation domain-containing protein